MVRCEWCGDDPLYIAYHDMEWGVPVHDDQALYAKLVLDGMQAGLSWITILRKRDHFYRAFDNFDIPTVANYGPDKIDVLMQDVGIIHNRHKISAAIKNAQGTLKIQEEFGSFDRYLWDFVGGKPVHNAFTTLGDIPAQTELSEKLSKDLKKRGFSFVGPTIIYAYMQAIGMVNDHVVDCFRYNELK
ncbi:MAG: DNA-3-methyladenine glycosylase I [Chloroflexi bacterium]|nr:DNA-3-methyladenine glycosylase I [Chloroflexota bacterium]